MHSTYSNEITAKSYNKVGEYIILLQSLKPTTSGQSSYSFSETFYAAISYFIVYIWITCALEKAWLYWDRE